MIEKQLESLGFSKGEIKIYLTLLQKGTLSKTDLAKEAKVSQSKTYEIIGKLQKKGLVLEHLKDNKSMVNANHPQVIYDIIRKKKENIEKQEQEIESYFSDLVDLYEKRDSEVHFELSEGKKAVFTTLFKEMKQMPRGGTFKSLGVKFFDEYSRLYSRKIRKERNITLKKIFSRESDMRIEYTNKNDEHKFMKGIDGFNLYVFPEKVMIIGGDNEPISLTIRHPEMEKALENIFDNMWKISKKCEIK